MKLSDLADRFSLVLDGDPDREITGVAALDEARATDISFLSNPRYAPKLKTTRAGAVIVGKKTDRPEGLNVLRAVDPYLAFARVLEAFYQPPVPPAGIHPTAVIDPTARVGRDVAIGPYVVVGPDATIGDRVTIQAHCVVYPGACIADDVVMQSHCVVREFVRIGARSRLQNHVTVGSDGFGYAKTPEGTWYKIVQSGTVVIEEDVEIGAGTQIDRASIGETRIRRGTKIDNLVQIGHGSDVGEDTLLCAQVGLAGSTRVGNRVTLAGQVGVAGHLEIGDGAIATAQTGIPNSVEPGKIVSGYPAIDNRDWLRSSAVFHRLPELQKTIHRLQARIEALEQANRTDAKN